MSERRWQPRETVLLRNTGFFVGAAWATPHEVVFDSGDLVVLFRPEGTPYESWDIAAQRIEPLGRTKMDMLRLMFPGRDYAVELFFDTEIGAPSYAAFEGDVRFRGWKVNIEAPFRRFDLGFDTTDHFLDIIVKPDRRYYWRDQEIMATWLDRGAYLQSEVDRFYASGRELEPLIEAAASPFDDEWTSWQPASRHPLEVPEGWQLPPGVELTQGLGRVWNDWPGAS